MSKDREPAKGKPASTFPFERVTPVHITRAAKQAWYDTLAASDQFAASYRALTEALGWLEPPEWSVYWPTLQNPPAIEPAELEKGSAMKVLLAEFGERWPLPTGWEQDLLWSYQNRRSKPNVAPASTSAVALRKEVFQIEVRRDIAYNPVFTQGRTSRKELHTKLKRLFSEITANAVQQANTIDEKLKAEGWDLVPPRYHKPETLDAAARQLYRRLVEGKSWGRIAIDSQLSRATVIEGAQQFASLIGIQIP